MKSAAGEFADDPCSSVKRGNMVRAARALLSAVTRLLILADMADVYKLLVQLKLVSTGWCLYFVLSQQGCCWPYLVQHSLGFSLVMNLVYLSGPGMFLISTCSSIPRGHHTGCAVGLWCLCRKGIVFDFFPFCGND